MADLLCNLRQTTERFEELQINFATRLTEKGIGFKSPQHFCLADHGGPSVEANQMRARVNEHPAATERVIAILCNQSKEFDKVDDKAAKERDRVLKGLLHKA